MQKAVCRLILAVNLRVLETSFFVILNRNMAAMIHGIHPILLNLLGFLIFARAEGIFGMSLADALLLVWDEEAAMWLLMIC